MMKRTLWLLIFPLILCLASIMYIRNSGCMFLTSVDPEYAYLFNGLLMASGKPDVPYVDHPGTPEQVIIAVVIRGVHLFRPGNDLITDVLKNPEIYLRSVMILTTLLAALMLFLMGRAVYRYTENRSAAWFIQLMPFVHTLSLEPLSRVIPEALMLSITCLWVIFSVRLLFDTKTGSGMKRPGLVLGILMGLSLADKLTYLSYAIIPFFLLHRRKQRFVFIAASVPSFFVFAFPVIFKYRVFYTWVRNIIFHTGKYGSGDTGIVHGKEFMDHLRLLLLNTPWLVMVWVFLAFILIIYSLNRKRGTEIGQKLTGISMALLLTVVFQLIMAAKQFAYHYMLPSILLMVPLGILGFVLLTDAFVKKIKPWMTQAVVFGAMIALLGHTVPRVIAELDHLQTRKQEREAAYGEYMNHRSHDPLVVCVSYYGCSAVEYALTFGLQESGKYGEILAERVKKLYPATVLYFPWDKTFYQGKNPITPSDFLFTNTTFDLYLADFTDTKLQEILAVLKETRKSETPVVTCLYHYPVTSEAMYRIQWKTR